MSDLILHPAHALAGFQLGKRKRSPIPSVDQILGIADPRYRLALGALRHMYRNRGTYRRAARSIQRAWRKRRAARPVKRARKHGVGKVRGTANSKRCEIENNNGFMNTRTLYQTELTEISKTSTNAINARQRDLIYISGFKICLEYQNKTTLPVYLNIAIVHDKRTNDSQLQITDLDDFFRGSAQQRTKSFSTALTGNEFRCLPLNTDRFTVLKHIRLHLTPNQATVPGFDYRNGRNYGFKQMWCPLKRQIRYGDDEHAQSKLWLIHWCDQFGRNSLQPAVSDAINFNKKIVTYFKETK